MTPDHAPASPAHKIITARLTSQAKRRLMALAQVLQKPAYAVLEDAFSTYWSALPASQKSAVRELLIDLIDRAREQRS